MIFSTPEFWVFIAFMLFLGSVGRKAFTFLARSLDQHSQKVEQRLAEAQRLHDEALSLLKTYQKKHEEALEQAAQILAFAEAEAMEFKKTKEHDFKLFLVQKEKSLLERIAIEKEETKLKLQKQAVDKAVEIVQRLLSKDMREKKKLTQTALEEISALSLSPLQRNFEKL